MTVPIADDYSAISARLRELTAVSAELSEECQICGNSGWEGYGIGIGDPHFRECPACGNPERKGSP